MIAPWCAVAVAAQSGTRRAMSRLAPLFQVGKFKKSTLTRHSSASRQFSECEANLVGASQSTKIANGPLATLITSFGGGRGAALDAVVPAAIFARLAYRPP